MNQKHITIDERIKIEVLLKEGYSARKIAIRLGVHHSTISREIKRCNHDYNAHEAEVDRIALSKNKGRKIILTNDL